MSHAAVNTPTVIAAVTSAATKEGVEAAFVSALVLDMATKAQRGDQWVKLKGGKRLYGSQTVVLV